LLLPVLPLLAGCVPGAAGVAMQAVAVGAQAGLSSGASTAQSGPTAQQIAAMPADEVQPLAVGFQSGIPASVVANRPVVVPAYGVSFLHTQNVSAVSQGGLMGGFGGGSARRASVRTGLTGISPATFQKVADEAHADLLAQLRAAGIQVAGAEGVEIPRVAGNALDGSSGSTFLGGQYSAWRTIGAAQAPLLQGLAGEHIGGGLGGMAMIGGNQAAGRVAEASGGVALVPLLRLDYVSTSSSGRGLLASRASAEASPHFSVSQGTQVAWAAPRRPGMGAGDVGMLLANPVGSDLPFATLSASGGRDGNWVGFGMRTDTAVTAVEERWLALARAAYRGFNAAIVQQIRAGRPTT
jgi:hypothetical protein